MNGRERGFLLLSSHLGNPARKPLTAPQLRNLTDRMRGAEIKTGDRDLTERDLTGLGYAGEMAQRILALLEDEPLLEHYLKKGKTFGCVPVTRVSEEYPLILRKRLGPESPGVLWARGNLSLLSEPTVALVGSRELQPQNHAFAAELGRQAAIQGYTLVSGNARGADKTTQEACLAAGGRVISVVADELRRHPVRENLLYLSEDGYDEPFSPQRALSRNRVIHAMGLKTFVAQSSFKTGGTWDGTVKNLRFGWSPVFCYEDGSEASRMLVQMGANPVGIDELGGLYDLENAEQNIFDR